MISDLFKMLYGFCGPFIFIPLLCFVLFLLSLIIYLIRRRRGASAEDLNTCKTMAKTFGIMTLCICLLIAAATALLSIAVANM
jgi:hypothetical protein